MNYFCDVVVTAKKDVQKRLFFVLDEPKNGSIPEFTQRMLYENAEYRGFIKNNKTKIYPVKYTVYKTTESVTANMSDDYFIDLIEKSERCSSGEFSMTAKLEVYKKGRSKSKFILVGISAVLIATGVGLGSYWYGSQITANRILTSAPEPEPESSNNTVDGMKILNQNYEETEDAEQITISLDRSYSAVPKDDIQLKGALINGEAEITLPEFDREDFFSHIPGYTYGFSSIPDGDKIEYYGGQSYKFTEDTKLYRVIVKYGGGSGTKEDPYIINYYDQLELMSEEKARGYFKQTCDIEFPEWASHTPIDTVNELKSEPEKEKFEYDGGGYAISNLTSPLFGKVSGALISNVNIQNSVINSSEYKYYGFIVCEAYNYQYDVKETKKSYETGETVIRKCSVSDSSIMIEYPEDENSENEVVVTAHEVEAPGRIEYDDKGNPITTSPEQAPPVTLKGDFAVGAVSGTGGQIESCYVNNFSVSCNIDEYFLYAGGISGKPANVTNSFVSSFSVSGRVFTSGGIAGSAGGSRKYNAMGETLPNIYGGNIQGCAAIKLQLGSEFAAGGLAGEGTSNAKDALISNSYVYNAELKSGTRENGVIKKTGYNGGIIGSDGQSSNGHKISNCVSPAEYKAIGSPVKSKGDDTVRLAPGYAYYQNTILDVLNANSIDKNNPSEIFTGAFKTGSILSDENGTLAYPEAVEELISRVNANTSNE